MKALLRILFASSVLLGGAVQATGKTINVKARAGATTPVYSYGVYDPTRCASMAPAKVSFRQPKHGTFTKKFFSRRISKGKPCAGKLIKGVLVSYRPKRGYRGRDRGKVGFTSSRFVDGGGSGNYFGVTVNITVK